jgi:hypothetical protein
LGSDIVAGMEHKDLGVMTQASIDTAVTKAFAEEHGAFASRVVSHLKDLGPPIIKDLATTVMVNAITTELEKWSPLEKKETLDEVVTRALQKILAG